MRYLISLLIAIAATAKNSEHQTLESILQTHPAALIQTERLSRNDEARFTIWSRDQREKVVSVKIRYDGGHKGGYASIKHGKHTIPVHVELGYSGEMPKTKRRVSLRSTKCRKTGEKHYKVTRTGIEIEVVGEIMDIREPLKLCKCGKPKLFTIKLKVRLIK
jgi:hypothetical protein